MVKKVLSKTQNQFLAMYKKINISSVVYRRSTLLSNQNTKFKIFWFILSTFNSIYNIMDHIPFLSLFDFGIFNELMYSWYPHVLLLFFNRKLIALWDWLVVELTVPTRLVAILIWPFYFWYSWYNESSRIRLLLLNWISDTQI